MKHVVCAVWDEKVQSFLRPFFAPRLGAAIRMFSDEVENKESPMFAHPEDYSLFELGEWNDEDGMYKEVAAIPRKVITALAVKDAKSV